VLKMQLHLNIQISTGIKLYSHSLADSAAVQTEEKSLKCLLHKLQEDINIQNMTGVNFIFFWY